MKSIILEKKQIRLKEDDSNAFVQPDEHSSSTSLANDITTAQKNNPNDDKFIFNSQDYDGRATTDIPDLSIKAKNPQDAQQQYQQMMKNPSVKQMMSKTNTNVTVDLQKEGKLYTKKELNKILF